jgi:hypothetical protein
MRIVLAFVMAAATLFSVMPANAARQGGGKLEIVTPAPGERVCSGGTTLIARDRGGQLAGPARQGWDFAAAGSDFLTAVTDPVPSLALGPPSSTSIWDTGAVPGGPVALEFTSGRQHATSEFVLDRAPVIGPIEASRDPETGLVTLSAPNAFDPDGIIARLIWYLGDGTVVEGPSAVHRYEPGKYVVDVEARDANGCVTTQTAGTEQPQQQPQQQLGALDFCDPLELSFTIEGPSDRTDWPNRQKVYGWGPGQVTTGFVHNAKTGAGYLFETNVRVYGNPDLCKTGQVYKGWFVRQLRNGLVEATGTNRWTDDDYDKPRELRKTSPDPRGDGTSNITWLDMPSVLRSPPPLITNAEIRLDFTGFASGVGADEHPAISEPEGPGETAWVHFRLCSAWRPPKATKDHSWKTIAAGGPDDLPPAQIVNPSTKNTPPFRPHVPGHKRIQGCGRR